MMNCAECQAQLVLYIEQLLDEAQAEQIAEHLKSCSSCQAELEGLQTLQGRLVKNGKAVAQSDLEEEVMNRIIREQNVRLKSAAQASAGLRLRRFLMKSPIAKSAVAAAVIISAVIVFGQFAGARPAFADIVRPILAARTAVFKVVTRVEGQPDMTMDAMFMEPGRGRHTRKIGDEPGQESISILNSIQGKGLVLMPAQKMAMVIEVTGQPDELDPAKVNEFIALRDRIMLAQESVDESVEYLGESQVNGRTAIGYRMTQDMQDMTDYCIIWADVETLLPLQVEYAMTETFGAATSVTMMDIEFDVDLDPALFSTEVPEGFEMHTVQADASPMTEADLVETLQISVDATGGKFPSDLTVAGMAELGKAFVEHRGLKFDGRNDLSNPDFREYMQTFQKINRGILFVRTLPADSDWRYAGTEATFGDATTPIFWYRPEGSVTYRVIYADLSVLDAAPEDLPQ